MRWLKRDHILDTERATRVLSVPPRVGATYGGANTRWTPELLGLKGAPRAMSHVALWLSDDGAWFLTSNPVTLRPNEDMTDYVRYDDWQDPGRTYEDLAGCCLALTPRKARELCAHFMGPEQYQRTFSEQVARKGQLTLDVDALAGGRPPMGTARPVEIRPRAVAH